MTRSPVRRLIFSLLRRVLYTWVRSETINQSAFTLKLDRSKPVFYVLQQPSLSDLAVLDAECSKAGLPRPVADVAVGELVEPAAFFFLNPAPSWFGRRTRLVAPQALVRLVGALEHNAVENAQIVPVSVFWGQSPNRETSAWKLLFADSWAVTGRLRKLLSILVLGRKTRVQFSAPIQLNELVAQNKGHERTLRMVHRMLRVHFRNQKTAVIGPDLSHRRNLVKGLVHAPQVRQAIREEAEREKITIEKAEARALRYGNEIASDYAYTAVRFLEVVLSWFWNKIYDGIRVNHIEPLQDAVRGYEVIYVPCHRSHIDYLLLSFVVYRNNLVPPHIAAGINLNMPVVGTILRRGGAFFMRRSFKDNKLYAAVFDEYMHTMLSRGFSVEYFIEGGRSRSGRMLKPKTGMLSMTLKSYLRDSNRPIAFVPVYVGYEKVLEARSYIGEMHGRRKRKESLYGLVTSSITYLRSRFGQVHVNFGDPIELNKFLDEQAPGWRDNRGQPDTPPDWFRGAVNQLGDEIVTRINNAAVANPINLLSLALLASPKHTMDEVQLRQQLALYLKLLQEAPYGEAVGLAERDPQAIIQYGIDNEFVQRVKHPLGDLITMETLTALQVTYVRNNSLHLFILPGLISALFRNARRISLDELHHLVHLMYPFFRTEYFLRWHTDAELDEAVDGIIKVMIDAELVSRDGDCLMGAGLHTPASDVLDHLGQIVLQALERFSLTIRLLVQRGSGSLTLAQLEELAHQTAQRLSLLYEFNSPEFFDRNVLKNFISQLQHYKLVSVTDNDMLQIDPELEVLDQEARRILTPEISQAIERITRLPVAQLDAPAA